MPHKQKRGLRERKNVSFNSIYSHRPNECHLTQNIDFDVHLIFRRLPSLFRSAILRSAIERAACCTKCIHLLQFRLDSSPPPLCGLQPDAFVSQQAERV